VAMTHMREEFLGLLFLIAVLIFLSFSAFGTGNASVAFGETTWFVVWCGSHASSSYDVYGSRVSQSGDVLDTPAIVLSVTNYQAHPAVAFDGTNWFVVWDKNKDSVGAIHAGRVSQSGEILDPEGIPISAGESYRFNPAVAFGTSSYLVVWTDYRNGSDNRDIYASRITPSGEVLDPEGIPISTAANIQHRPSVAFDGVNWLVVWQDSRDEPSYEGDIYAARVTQSGEVLDPEGFPITIAENFQMYPQLAFGEENYLVVWHGPGGDGARVSPAGVVLDPDGLDLLGMVYPAVAFGETGWLAVKISAQGSYQTPHIKGVLVAPSASVQSLPDIIGLGWRPISAAFGESSWLVTWTGQSCSDPQNIFGACVSQSGEILAPMFKISSFLECAVELREQGTSSQIDEIEVGEFFDIYIQVSTVDTNITHVRFSSDDYLNGNREGPVTDWYDWNTSSGDWNHITKTKAWVLATTGEKEVWAEVRDDAGDTSLCYARIDVVVGQPPVLAAAFSFSPTNPTTADIVQFIDQSTSGDQIVAWSWNFGDGGGSSVQNPTHQYGLPGSYNVTLTVTDAGGATCSTVREVTIQQHENHPPDPPANLTQLLPEGTAIPVGDAVSTDTVFFKGTVTDPDGDTVKLQVELRRLDEFDGNFDDTQGGLKDSGLVSSGIEATCTANGLISGDYHWRARAIDEHALASNWVDFGGNALAEADFTIPAADTTPPALIQDFTASDGEDRQSTLTWTNPSDSDLDRVIVKCKTDGYPSSHTDGDTRITIDVATPGRQETRVDGALTNGRTYYYAVFSKDTSGNWQKAVVEGANANTGLPAIALLDVPFQHQGSTSWCWATCASMILSYFGIEKEPWEIAAADEFNAGPNDGLNFIWAPYKFHNYLEEYYDNGHEDAWARDLKESNTAIKETIVESLEWGPVWTALFSIGHVIVVVGASGDQSMDYIYFHDPQNIAELTGDAIFQKMTWDEFFEAISSLSTIDAFLIYARQGMFDVSGSMPITVSPLGDMFYLRFSEQGSALKLEWDGSEPYPEGYHYQIDQEGSFHFPTDASNRFGYAVTMGSTLEFDGVLVSNATDARIQLTVEAKMLPENTTIATEVLNVDRFTSTTALHVVAPLSDYIDTPGIHTILFSVSDIANEVVYDTSEVSFSVLDLAAWRRDVSPGDILYDPTFLAGLAGHVGIYTVNGKVIEANKSQGVYESNISTWDYPHRKEATLLGVSASAAIAGAISFAKEQRGKPYDRDWTQKDPSSNSASWYCSELVWAAYFNQGVNLEHVEHILVFDEAVTPKEIHDSPTTYFKGRHCEESPGGGGLEFRAACPVHIVVTDPDGMIISREENEVPEALYIVDDLNGDGSSDCIVGVLHPKAGVYQVKVIPETDANPNSTYSLIIHDHARNTEIVLAHDIPVKDAPQGAYIIRMTDEGIERISGVVPAAQFVNHGPSPVSPEGCIFWLNLPDDTVGCALKIFDIDGALLVSIPLDGMADRYPGAGRWIPEDDQGRLLGTGLYIYLVEMEHADGTVTYSPPQKMVIQR